MLIIIKFFQSMHSIVEFVPFHTILAQFQPYSLIYSISRAGIRPYYYSFSSWDDIHSKILYPLFLKDTSRNLQGAYQYDSVEHKTKSDGSRIDISCKLSKVHSITSVTKALRIMKHVGDAYFNTFDGAVIILSG